MSEAVKELIDIVIKLRSDNGCDWDRKQTSESLTPHLIEEANEVVDAVLEKNSENLKEELGDLLLHVVFQAVIASEKKKFEFEDVVQQINEKLIKRHPHIFDENYDGEDLSNAKNWELIKKSEKNRESILDGMPKSLSALIVAQRYQDKTGAVGFEWENFSQAMDKVDEELGELKQAINNNDLNNIREDYRIRRSIPTIDFLINAGAKVILGSHLGRPKGSFNENLSLKKVLTVFAE